MGFLNVVSLIVGLFCLVGVCTGAPVAASSSSPPPKQCKDLMLKVPVKNAPNYKIAFDTPQTQEALTGAGVLMTSAGSRLVQDSFVGISNITRTFNIGATLCAPTDPAFANATVVQHLTHGVPWARSYWDLSFDGNSNFSYVDAATRAGYWTLAVDRLGTGLSDHSDGTQIVQSAVAVEIMHQINGMLRNGSIGGRAFKKVVNVGHSYGSALSNGLAAKYPDSSDALVLTGYSHVNDYFVQNIVALNIKFFANSTSKYASPSSPKNYLAPGEKVSLQTVYYRHPYYPPASLEYLVENLQPVTIGQGWTLLSGVVAAPKFTGPVLTLTGHEDFWFCGGNCSAHNNLTGEAQYYPASRNASALIPAQAGHALNCHYSAALAYEKTQAFLKANGV